MPHPATDYDELRPFLYADPVRNATLIGGIEKTLPHLNDVWLTRTPAGRVSGVLAFAAGGLGGPRSVVLAGDGAAADQFFRWLPSGEELSIQLSHPELAEPLADRFLCRHEATMRAYRCGAAEFLPREHPDARELREEDRSAVERVPDSHFTLCYRRQLENRRNEDGDEIHVFGCLCAGSVVGRCVTTWNETGIQSLIGTVWSVYTQPSFRGRGVARAVVSAATRRILQSGRTARYLCYRENLASNQVCRSLGYRHSHDIHFFLAWKR